MPLRVSTMSKRESSGLNTSLSSTVYTDSGSFDLHLEANEIRWYNL